jgi:protease-4
LVTPGSVLQLDGLTASATFVGEAMEKLGIQWEVARVGAYKNAPDTFTRSSMSSEQREALNAYLDTDFRVYVESVTASRKLTEAQFKEGLNEGLKSPTRALELKWVDEIINPQQLDEKLKEWHPGARFDANYIPRGLRETRWGNRPRIALIPVIGNITGGRSRQDPFGFSQSAGAETVVRALKQAEEDSSIEAIVLRIDSGGGDTLASELMYRAVLEARKKKPVIASMGDVAASGGYYVAMGADTVFAQPTTVTGSIGVFFIKPAVAGLASKLGIRNETLKRGERAGMLGLFEPWSVADRAAAQKWVDGFYDTFISEVARCRKLSKEQVDAVARGRVWAGQDALSRGLVDRPGGLAEAIALAREKAQIPVGESVDLVIPQSPVRLFSGAGAALAQALQENTVEPAFQKWAQKMGLELPLEPETGLLARMEFQLHVQ